MANILVCCGGTGAHVGLAFMRLHALGHPLGFFREQNGDGQTGKPLKLPSIYLVDQDDGDGDHGETAWQTLRGVIENHPSRSEWGDTSGKQAPPRGRVLTPLPVGPNKEWIKKSHDRLLSRFEGMDYLECMASSSQAAIQFSHGMMGSPAVGSLLFRMKTCDLDSDGINNDAEYENLHRQRGRFAVVGSAVGGTGSSVGPTLAQILADLPDSDVMAVMVLDWFRLDEDPNRFDAATVKRAQARKPRHDRECEFRSSILRLLARKESSCGSSRRSGGRPGPARLCGRHNATVAGGIPTRGGGALLHVAVPGQDAG